MLRDENQSLFTTQRALRPCAPGPGEKALEKDGETRGNRSPARPGPAPSAVTRPGGSCRRRLPLFGRRLRSRRPLFPPPRRCSWARTPLPGRRRLRRRRKRSCTSPWAPRARREPSVRGSSAAGAQLLLLRAGPGTTVPAPAAAAAAASARIRARLGHRAIITGARGDVTRTPAPPPPPRGVLENCGARAPRTRAHTHCAPGVSRAHSPRPAPRAPPLTWTPPWSALDRAWRPVATRMATGTPLSHAHRPAPPAPLPHPRERHCCSPPAAAPSGGPLTPTSHASPAHCQPHRRLALALRP